MKFIRHSFLIIFFSVIYSHSIAQEVKTGCYYVKEQSDSTIQAFGKKDTLWLDKQAIITVKDFKKVKLVKQDYGYALEITLYPEGAEVFRVATSKWIQKKMAIVVNNEIITAPIVACEIPGGRIMVTSGWGTKEEMKAMKLAIESEIKRNKN